MYDIRPMPPQIDPAIVSALLETDTGTIGHFLDTGAMDPGVEGKLPGAKIVGTAITIRVTVPDSLLGHYALSLVRPGDVLVVDRGTDKRTACFGGTSILAASRLGVAAIIMDGAGNDIAEANAFGLPIWCRGVTPVTTQYLNHGGALNAPIVCGGVLVQPGDVVMADENGIFVFDPAKAQEIVDKGRIVAQKEVVMRAKIRENPQCFAGLTGSVELVEAKLREMAG